MTDSSDILPRTSSNFSQRRRLAWKESMQMKATTGRVNWKEIYSKYGVDETSISRYVRMGKEPSTRSEENKRRAKLSSEDDEVIEKWIMDQNQLGKYPSLKQIFNLANYLYKNRCGSELKYKTWGQSWNRSQKVKLARKQIISIQRRAFNGYSYDNCKQYFQQLNNIIPTIDYDLIYNFDEIGFNIGDLSVLKGKQFVEGEDYMKESINQGRVTVIETIRSNGSSLKPYIIFKNSEGKGSDSDTFNDDVIIDNHQYTTEFSNSGWSTKETCMSFLKNHLDPITKEHAMRNGILRPRLFIIDVQSNQIDEEFIQYCTANNIIVLQLPPLSAWKLQPLDMGILNSYKQSVLQSEDSWFYLNQQKLTRSQFINIILQSRLKALTNESIIYSFRNTYIFPFDSTFLDRIPQKGSSINKQFHELLEKEVTVWLARIMELTPEEEEAIGTFAGRRYTIVSINQNYGRLSRYFSDFIPSERDDEEEEEEEEEVVIEDRGDPDTTLTREEENLMNYLVATSRVDLTGTTSNENDGGVEDNLIINEMKNNHEITLQVYNKLSEEIANLNNNVAREVFSNSKLKERNLLLLQSIDKEIQTRRQLEKVIDNLKEEVNILQSGR